MVHTYLVVYRYAKTTLASENPWRGRFLEVGRNSNPVMKVLCAFLTAS